MKTPQKPFSERNSSPKAQKRIAKIAKLVGADPKAMKIVFDASFDLDDDLLPWVYEDDVPAEAREYVIRSGLVAAPFSITPNAAIKRLLAARDKIDRADVTAAFAESLVSGRPDYRSILGTYACFFDLNEKQLLAASKEYGGLAGLHEGSMRKEYDPLEVVFTRFFRSNSMEHDGVVHAILEFEDFKSGIESSVGNEVVCRMLDAIRALPKDAQLTELNKALQGVFKGNKHDRQCVLETLGYCDILRPKSRGSFRGKYHRLEYCSLPDHFYKKEWRYPVCWWTGADGVNEEAVSFWFPIL